jgi:hypothetical protein
MKYTNRVMKKNALKRLIENTITEAINFERNYELDRMASDAENEELDDANAVYVVRTASEVVLTKSADVHAGPPPEDSFFSVAPVAAIPAAGTSYADMVRRGMESRGETVRSL